MERNLNKMVALARCPQCNSLCVNGHDDDYQISCAKCGGSFVPKSLVYKTQKDYEQLARNARKRYDRGGWIAFSVDD